MPVIGTDRLVALQHNPNEIRNICILAHVDHGKTSLADSLIATNGIISSKLAGKIRYLDSRPDEQLRGITMESSAISLYFSMIRRISPSIEPTQKEYLINLIDSPGHIDFSSEVSTASRLCDGALVLVDAVEGIQSQTITVLRQTWIERLKPLLVINKMDRLITELRMNASEAYAHLSQLIEQVNAIIGSFFQGERMEEDLQWREKMDERIAAKEHNKAERKATQNSTQTLTDEHGNLDPSISQDEFLEKDDEELYFAPEKQNVIFSSAIDGWAFTVRQFAHLYEKKLGIKSATLEKVLWGDYYLDPKTKRILGSKHLKGRHLKPMFVQLVLENIWAVYEATTRGDKGKGDPAMTEKITKSLSLKIPIHVLRSRDPRAILTTIFSSWLPLSTAVLVSVIEYLPSPPVAQSDRLPKIIAESPGGDSVDSRLKDAMIRFQTAKEEPTVAYISKMVAIRQSELPQHKRKEGSTMTGEEARDLARKKRAEIEKAKTAHESTVNGSLNGISEALDDAKLNENADAPDDPEQLIGFARLYSGNLSVGDTLYVLSPKFSPANPHASPEPQKVTITGLYLMMGRGLENLSSAPAGSVVGIAGLQGHVLKNATLSSQLEGSVNLAGVSMGGQPIVRVALEPVSPADLEKMIAGLKLLEQSDPCARYEVMDSGEHVILTAGEVHLERCLNDLQERLAKCEIQAGEPIVPYRETVVNADEMRPPKDANAPRGTVTATTSSKQVSLRIRMQPLPASVVEVLLKNEDVIRSLYAQKEAQESGKVHQSEDGMDIIEEAAAPSVTKVDLKTATKLREDLKAAIVEAKQPGLSPDIIDKIIAFGPRRVGPNILIDETSENLCDRFLKHEPPDPTSSTIPTPPNPPSTDDNTTTTTTTTTLLHPRDLLPKFLHAFQLATSSGPLCAEPLSGTLTSLHSLTLTSPQPLSSLPRLTGEIIRTTRDALSTSFLDWSPRLLLATYSCSIQAHTSVLGRVYATLSKHNATILSETLPPNSSSETYLITSLLPIASSFGFSSALLTATSGHASPPQLVWSGYRMLDEDPFWVPRTEEELEDWGEKHDRENGALKVVEGVRLRKGLMSRKVKGEGGRGATLKR